MKKIFFWFVLIGSIVALIGSCAKSDDETTTTATTYVSTNTTASGSITVGSETMSGTYASACLTNGVDNLIAGGALSSDAKAYGEAIVVISNDNVSQELIAFSDTSCTSQLYRNRTVFDNITVGSVSGSNYPLTLTKVAQGFTVNTTTAETWFEAIYSGLIDLTVDTELFIPYGGSTNPRYGLINLTSTTMYWTDVDDAATPSTLSDNPLTKQ